MRLTMHLALDFFFLKKCNGMPSSSLIKNDKTRSLEPSQYWWYHRKFDLKKIFLRSIRNILSKRNQTLLRNVKKKWKKKRIFHCILESWTHWHIVVWAGIKLVFQSPVVALDKAGFCALSSSGGDPPLVENLS